jgi:hypothetical protein
VDHALKASGRARRLHAKRPRNYSGAVVYVKLGSRPLGSRSRGSLLTLFLSALWFYLPTFTRRCTGRRRTARLTKCLLPLWPSHMPAPFGGVRRAAGRLFWTWADQAALRLSFLFAGRPRCLGSCQGRAGLPGRWWSRLQSPPTRPAALFSRRRTLLDAWRDTASWRFCGPASFTGSAVAFTFFSWRSWSAWRYLGWCSRWRTGHTRLSAGPAGTFAFFSLRSRRSCHAQLSLPAGTAASFAPFGGRCRCAQ